MEGMEMSVVLYEMSEAVTGCRKNLAINKSFILSSVFSYESLSVEPSPVARSLKAHEIVVFKI